MSWLNRTGVRPQSQTPVRRTNVRLNPTTTNTRSLWWKYQFETPIKPLQTKELIMAATIHYLNSPHHPAVRSAYVRAMPRPAQAVYRRRRVGVLAIAVAIAAIGTFGLNGTEANANPAMAGQQTEPNYVIAQSGDTLWAIANRIAPQANTSDLVDELVRMNGDSISVGQRVLIP